LSTNVFIHFTKKLLFTFSSNIYTVSVVKSKFQFKM